MILESFWKYLQEANAKNQREHLVLLLANAQMRLQPAAGDKVDIEKISDSLRTCAFNLVVS